MTDGPQVSVNALWVYQRKLGQCAMLRIEEIEPGPGKGDWSGMALSLYSVFCVALLALGSELIKGTGTSVSDSSDSTQCNLPCNCPALKQGTGKAVYLYRDTNE